MVDGQLDLNELIPEASLHLDKLQQKLLSGASGKHINLFIVVIFCLLLSYFVVIFRFW